MLTRSLNTARAIVATIALCAAGVATLGVGVAPATAAGISPTSSAWCVAQGSSVVGWVASSPSIPICGPGPDYGGTWQMIDVPGPYGGFGTYFNATPGFQCVELAERYLSVVDGITPVHANGSTVVMNYHAANPNTRVVVSGSSAAVGNPPRAGNVLSFAQSPSFGDAGDGHTAVVVASSVNGAGNGTVEIAQENVSVSDVVRTLDLDSWRLVDPQEPSDAEFQYPYAEWLVVPSARPAVATDDALVHPTRDPLVQPLVSAGIITPHLFSIGRDRVRAHHQRARRRRAVVRTSPVR